MSGQDVRGSQTDSTRAPLRGAAGSVTRPASLRSDRLIGLAVCSLFGIAIGLVEEVAVWLPGPLLALAAGLLLGRTAQRRLQPGATIAATQLLHTGIVLLGFRLSLQQLQGVGSDAMLLIVPCVLIGGCAAFAAATLLGLEMRTRILLAAGTAICGNSAIATIAPSIDARDEDVAVSVTTVTLYGTLALFIFPFAAYAVGLSAKASGFWAGLAINDTSQVVAASYSMSDGVGAVATIVKLARNLFIAPLAIVLSVIRARHRGFTTSVRSAIPWFVVFFVAAVAIASLLTLPTGFTRVASDLSGVLILTALTGMGIRAAGLRLDRRMLVPLGAGGAAGVILALVSLLLVIWVI